MKGYKVSDAGRTRLCGVACSSLEQLKKKGGEKLKIPAAKMVVQIQDGTIIDDEDYFQTLPAQTVFILLKPGDNVVTAADLIYNALAAVNSEYLRAGRLALDFLTTDLRDKVREFSALVASASPSTLLSRRSDHPDWFAGLDTRAPTKERFMFMRSQERIRGYYYKTADDVRKTEVYRSDGRARKLLDGLFEGLRSRLKEREDYGCLFDRSAEEERLCDERGEFRCQGRWDKEECLYGIGHRINPYESREARIVFSTWNLDHGVERSRSVLPAILEAASTNPDVCLLQEHAFFLLFTRRNLKFVNIVCHDKGAHVGCTNPHYEGIKAVARGNGVAGRKRGAATS